MIAISVLVLALVGFWGIGSLYKPDISSKPASTAVIEPAAREPDPSTIPTTHTDPKMALTYAKQHLADLKANYARNEALYQDKDNQGLLNIRSELLLDAMNTNENDHTSEMLSFTGCGEAYKSLVSLNYYYISESDFQDDHDLKTIAEHKKDYDYWLELCEQNIQSSSEP